MDAARAKSGYIEQQFGQRSAFATTDPIVLAEGQQFVADFRLSRGGAIAGRVVDEFGEPLAGANVTALRIQNTAQGVRTTRTGVPVPSDDNGACGSTTCRPVSTTFRSTIHLRRE